MADIIQITLPDGTTYDVRDSNAITAASINNTGLISYKNSSGTTVFTLQLPKYDGSVS